MSEIMREEMKKNENVARYLDGEKLQLDAEEQALLEEFRLDESAVNDTLPSACPSEVTKLIRAKLAAALNTGQSHRRIIRMVRWGAVAAAAIVIITAAVLYQAPDSQDSTTLAGYTNTLSQDLLDEIFNNNNSEFVDPSEDEINVFLEPLFLDDTAQTFMDNDISETDLIDDYFDEPDNVMLNPSGPARA